VILQSLAPDQNKDSCQQGQHASNDADAKSSEGEDSDRDKINREQKHADIFGNHVVSIDNCTRA
jgi:hypothetical protein